MGDETQWRHVGIKVEQSQYGEWKEYQEQSDFGSMSQLIRTAVEREMSDTPNPDFEVGTAVDQDSDHTAELVDTVATMEQRLAELSGNIDEATTAMYQGATTVSEDVITDVYAALPVVEVPPKNHETGEYGGIPDRAVYPDQVAERIDRDPATVAVALDQLEQSTSVEKARRVADDGEVAVPEDTAVYWREP